MNTVRNSQSLIHFWEIFMDSRAEATDFALNKKTLLYA